MEGLFVRVEARPNGAPDVTLPESVHAQRLATGRVLLVHQPSGRHAVFSRVGGAGDLFAGLPVWFTATTGGGAKAFLEGLEGVQQVATVAEARAHATFWPWLLSLNLRAVRRVSDDQVVGIVPPTCIMGQNPIALAVGPDYDHEGDPVYIPRAAVVSE